MGDLHDTGHDLAALLRGGTARDILRWRRRNLCACTWECAVTNSALHSPRTLLRLGGSALLSGLALGLGACGNAGDTETAGAGPAPAQHAGPHPASGSMSVGSLGSIARELLTRRST